MFLEQQSDYAENSITDIKGYLNIYFKLQFYCIFVVYCIFDKFSLGEHRRCLLKTLKKILLTPNFWMVVYEE